MKVPSFQLISAFLRSIFRCVPGGQGSRVGIIQPSLRENRRVKIEEKGKFAHRCLCMEDSLKVKARLIDFSLFLFPAASYSSGL